MQPPASFLCFFVFFVAIPAPFVSICVHSWFPPLVPSAFLLPPQAKRLKKNLPPFATFAVKGSYFPSSYFLTHTERISPKKSLWARPSESVSAVKPFLQTIIILASA